MKFTAFALLFLAGTFNLGNALRMTGKMESTATAEALSKQKEQLANGNMQGVPHPHRFHGVAIYPDRGIYPFRFAEENANGGSHGQPPVMTTINIQKEMIYVILQDFTEYVNLQDSARMISYLDITLILAHHSLLSSELLNIILLFKEGILINPLK